MGPRVLINPQGVHPDQALGPAGAGGGLELDRSPRGAPGHLQLVGQGRDGGVVMGQRVGGPHRRPAGQPRSRGGQLVNLAEAHHRTRPLGAAPQPLAPHQPHRGAEGRHVVQAMLPAPVGGRENPAPGTPRRTWGGFDRQRHGFRPVLDAEYVDVGQVEQRTRWRASRHGTCRGLTGRLIQHLPSGRPRRLPAVSGTSGAASPSPPHSSATSRSGPVGRGSALCWAGGEFLDALLGAGADLAPHGPDDERDPGSQ